MNVQVERVLEDDGERVLFGGVVVDKAAREPEGTLVSFHVAYPQAQQLVDALAAQNTDVIVELP